MNSDRIGRPAITDCDAAAVLPIITSKWTMPVVYCLSAGPLRFSELKRRLQPMADSDFSKDLKGLCTQGIIERRDHRTVPPHVEYSLTELGSQLLPVMDAIEKFGRRYAEQHARVGRPCGPITNVATEGEQNERN